MRKTCMTARHLSCPLLVSAHVHIGSRAVRFTKTRTFRPPTCHLRLRSLSLNPVQDSTVVPEDAEVEAEISIDTLMSVLRSPHGGYSHAPARECYFASSGPHECLTMSDKSAPRAPLATKDSLDAKTNKSEADPEAPYE